MKRYLYILVLVLPSYISAQLVSWDPVYFTEDDSVTIYFDATLGNGGLEDYTGTVYAHTGVITSLSESSSDWRYVVADWSTNETKAALTRVSDNLYSLTISPSIVDYYVTDEGSSLEDGETIEKLAFVFRSSDGSREGKTSAGGDIFVELGLGINILEPAETPYNAEDDEVFDVVAVGSTITDTLKLYVSDTLMYTTTDDTLKTTVTATHSKGWVKIVGTNTDNQAVADSFFYYVNPDLVLEDLPDGVEAGINYVADSTVTLALYAQNKDFVYLIGDFNNWEIDPPYFMNRTTDGSYYWITIDGLDPDVEYGFQYLVEGELRIADPYTEKVMDRWYDSSIPESVYPDIKDYPVNKTEGIISTFQINQEEYTWQVNDFERPDKEKLVIYELLVRDFVSTHSYQTLIDTLSYLKTLGVSAIELMPVFEFEGNSSWGYNPSFYYAVDKYYGTKNDLKEFVDACHEEGLAVILDIVLNHVYGENPWVQLYFEDGKPSSENPWFNEESPNTAFSYGYDWNHESALTKQIMKRTLSFWLDEFHFDGFRLDFTKGLTNTVGDGSAYDASRIAILEDYADHIWSVDSSAYVILEHFADNTEEIVLSDYGMMLWGNLNYNYNEATMGYISSSDFGDVSYLERNWNYPYIVGYMESHDEERLMYKNLEYGNASGDYNIQELNIALQRMKLAAAFFFTVPGPKMIWQFGELGYDVSIDYNGRVGEKPIYWDYLDSVTRLRLYKTFAALINLRNSYEVFQTDDFLIGAANKVKRIRLNHDSMDVNILGNFDVAENTTTAVFQNTGMWYDYFSGDSIEVTDVNMNLTLVPGEFHIYTTVKLPTPEADLLTGIQGDEDVLVTEYQLLQNYPNPFNPATRIQYQIPKGGKVSLKIYNIVGQEIKTLFSGEQAAGSHTIQWNGTNNFGQRVSSGVYFYRLEAGDYTSVKKMLMLK